MLVKQSPNDLDACVDFAETCKEPAVYSVLASAQLAIGQTVEAISTFFFSSFLIKYLFWTFVF